MKAEYTMTQCSENKNTHRGRLFVISAPSGAGKTTLCKSILNHFDSMHYSISFTTRPARKVEQNGVDYHFISKTEFLEKRKKNQWAEWAEVHGNYYGTSTLIIDHKLANGHDILLDIDVQGTKQILKRYPDTITIFIMPPSLEILRLRLEKRGTENNNIIEKRMKNAVKEIKENILYHHIVINDKLPETIKQLLKIINNHTNTAIELCPM